MKRVLERWGLKAVIVAGVVAVLAAGYTLASRSSEGPAFAGVTEKDGPSAIKKKLRAVGFYYDSTSANYMWFRGRVLGKQTTAVALLSPDDKLARLVLMIPTISAEIYTIQGKAVDLLKEKYGAPTKVVDNNPDILNDTMAALRNLMVGNVDIRTLWELDDLKVVVITQPPSGVWVMYEFTELSSFEPGL